MSMNIALTGINAANKDLGVVSDNIANANTTGFKKARTEFGDLVNSMSLNREGMGVRLQGLTQTFSQGSIEDTGRTFDLAITGDGFFRITKDSGLKNDDKTSILDVMYTRAGAFHTTPPTTNDTKSYIINNMGQT